MSANQVCLVLSVYFKSMLLRRRSIIKSYLAERQKRRRMLRIHLIKLRRTLYIAQTQIPKQIFTSLQPRFRRFKTKNRDQCRYHNLRHAEHKESFFEDFRMSFSSYELLCSKLRPYLEEPVGCLTNPVPINKQVAMCVYKLSTCSDYRIVGHVFGVHKSTVCKYFHIVIDAILKLQNELIKFPNEEEAINIAKSFEKISHIPNIIGCIDGSHIPVLPPAEGYRDYINRKGWPSMVLQAVVDHNYIFRDISIQFPGSAHDATVFKESGLYKNAAVMIPKYEVEFDGTRAPLSLAGDVAYPLLRWLLKPYTGNVTTEEESFNCYLSTARTRVENAFGRLKGRWRCLAKRIDVNPAFVPKVVAASVILHNFVEQQKEKFFEEWAESEPAEYIQPISYISQENMRGPVSDPKVVRSNIKNYLANNFPLRKSSFPN